MTADLLLPDREERTAPWSELDSHAESYFEGVGSLPVAPALQQAERTELLEECSFDEPGS